MDAKLGLGESGSKPGMSFLLGTVLVILVILIATAIVLCFYHWAQLIKDAISSASSPPLDLPPLPAALQGAIFVSIDSLPSCTADVPVVYMPGNEMPTFIAFPCPYSIESPGVKLKEAPTTSFAKAELKSDILNHPICESTNSNGSI